MLQRIVLYGDPAQPEVWKQLDDVLLRKYRHANGMEIPVKVAAVDSGGHYTAEVYQYARARKSSAPTTYVIAIKGQSQRGKSPIGKPTKQDVNFRGQVLRSGVDLYPVGSDTIKTTLYGRLKHNEPGPGFIHFHAGLTEEFFAELTAEKQVTRYVKGFPVREWVKKNGARNEALDEMVYAYAAMQFLYMVMNRATIWDQLEGRMGIKPDSKKITEAEPKPEKPVDSDPIKLQRNERAGRMNVNGRRGGFVSSW